MLPPRGCTRLSTGTYPACESASNRMPKANAGWIAARCIPIFGSRATSPVPVSFAPPVCPSSLTLPKGQEQEHGKCAGCRPIGLQSIAAFLTCTAPKAVRCKCVRTPGHNGSVAHFKEFAPVREVHTSFIRLVFLAKCTLVFSFAKQIRERACTATPAAPGTGIWSGNHLSRYLRMSKRPVINRPS